VRSTFVTQYITCEVCFQKLIRKLKMKEKACYIGQPHRFYGQHGVRMFSGCYVDGRDYENVISILIKSVICHPVTVAIVSEDGIKEMNIEPLEVNCGSGKVVE
jgi:hypothetical protein